METHAVALVVLSFLFLVFGQEEVPGDAGDSARECFVSTFKLQEEFDPILYQGLWYVRSVNRPWSAIPFLPMAKSNVQVYYRLRQDRTIDIITGASALFMCDYVKGTGTIEDFNQPQKMTFTTNNIFGQPGNSYPYWVVKTDYDNYAVVYSCLNIHENDTCSPEHTYLFVLSRKLADLESAQIDLIQEAATSCCVSPQTFIEIKHNGNCQIDPSQPPKCGKTLVFLYGVGIILFMVLVTVVFLLVIRASAARKKKVE